MPRTPANLNSGTRYQLLARTLLRRIADGTYPPDSLLPTERDLCEQFNVSRITVRGAMRELQARGVISRRAGIGTRVAAAQPRAAFMHVGNSIDDILHFTRGLTFHTLDVRELVADGALAGRVGLPAGQRFLRVTGVRRNGKNPPAVLSFHYVPILHALVVEAMDGYKASLAELLAESRGDVVEDIQQAMDATRLTAREARWVEARPGSACLRSTRQYHGRGGALIVATVSLYPEGRYVFNSRLRRDHRQDPLAD